MGRTHTEHVNAWTRGIHYDHHLLSWKSSRKGIQEAKNPIVLGSYHGPQPIIVLKRMTSPEERKPRFVAIKEIRTIERIYHDLKECVFKTLVQENMFWVAQIKTTK